MAGLKSVSLTFQSPTRVNKDPCCYSFNLGTAKIVRADPGTENVKVEVLQNFFRANGRDSFSGDKSFMYGKSTANQVKIMPYCNVSLRNAPPHKPVLTHFQQTK